MSDDWDFYLCRVDDMPASIFVDLGVKQDAPMIDRPYMAYIILYMRAPRPDGLSSQEEFDELLRVEHHLENSLVAEGARTYVGRNTSGGRRDFVFYVADPSDWEMRVQRAMQDFAHYEFESGSRKDEEWKTYFEFLHPSPQVMQSIQNRRVCDSLAKHGDAMTEPREIDHWAYFPDAASRSRFSEAILRLGFSIRIESEPEVGEERFGLQFFRIDLPSHAEIDGVTMPPFKAASDEGGEYDGWETEVIR